jgi:acetolactate synthase I/II/III large subunit
MNKPSGEGAVAKSGLTYIDRRNFIRKAAFASGASAAALVAPGKGFSLDSSRVSASLPDEAASITDAESMTTDRPGADFMVDVLKSLGFEYLCATPGSSYRGLYESAVNYGGNVDPKFTLCCHEESAVAMCHGYSKIEGKPVWVGIHGTVGLQHAAMAIYNAYCDRAPIYIIMGNVLDSTMRRPALDTIHSAQDPVAMVRDFVKWDDQPTTLQGFAESAVRAYRIAMTPPMMPVVLVADYHIQENPIPASPKLSIPKLTLPQPPQGESGAVAEAARLLVQAEKPVIVVDRGVRTPAGMQLLVDLAESLQAPVIDQLGRMNFPSRHPLNQSQRSTELISEADVILGLELSDYWGTVNEFRDQLHRSYHPIVKPGTKLISVSVGDLFMKSNFQDMHRFEEVDLDIAADVEATVPSLIEEIKRQSTASRKSLFRDRGARLALVRRKDLEQAREDATYAWDASPISVARLCTELWAQIKDEDWSFVSLTRYFSRWPQRLWDFTKPYQFIGGSGGLGIGYNAPASVGAALANRKYGRLTVNIQSDGDLLFAPGILWTAAHNRIPILNIMHNNRAYHAEMMQFQTMACQHNRGIDNAHIVTAFEDPYVDFAKLAQGLGVYAEGPITDPKDLGPAIKRAIEVVKRGEPALVDAVCEGR